MFSLTEVDMRFLMAVMAILAVAVLSASAHAGPFRRPTARPTTCVGGACQKAVTVTTAPVRVVRKVVGR
jgi:predicted carbohydrate-binding protein with CBM5 and CBM33 domain